MDLENMRTRERFGELYPERDYTPKKRDLEIKFISKKKKEIEKSNITEENKKSITNLLDEYLIQYEKTYAGYEMERKKREIIVNEAIYRALAFMN